MEPVRTEPSEIINKIESEFNQNPKKWINLLRFSNNKDPIKFIIVQHFF